VVSAVQLRALGVGRSAITRRVGAVQLHRLYPAAAHWGLLKSDQRRIDVTARHGPHGAPGIRLHSSRSLDAQDTSSHQGIPTTTVHRTLLDLAATARTSELERALAQAERLQIHDHCAIEGVIARPTGTAAPQPGTGDDTRAQVDAQRMGSRRPDRPRAARLTQRLRFAR
jgi:hypothetical protein